MPLSQNEVNIIVMGDWGNDKTTQKTTAANLAKYVEKTGRPFNATLLAGDNFYVKLSGVQDYQWQSLFEDMYDAQKLAMPFYVALGNHDYEQTKAQIERDYARKNPDSRWKYPAKWYRVDFPAKPAKPLLTVLMLDSNKPKLSKEEWAEQISWMDAELSKPGLGEWTAACAQACTIDHCQLGTASTVITRPTPMAPGDLNLVSLRLEPRARRMPGGPTSQVAVVSRDVQVARGRRDPMR